MAERITVGVTGAGAFAGRKSSLTGYSVDESITPLDASLGNSGAGTINFGAVEDDDSVFLMDNGIELRDGARGIVTGTVRSVSSGNYALSVVADSILVQLNAKKTAQAFSGTLGNAITYYLGLVGITGGFQVEPALAARTVVLPGWVDNVLDMITQLCVAQQIEMSVVYDNIVFRAPRQNVAVARRRTSNNFAIDRGNPAKTVECYYYNHASKSNTLVYPSTMETDRDGWQVDPGQTLEPTRVQLSGTLTSVVQPVAVDFLNPAPYVGGTGAYVVIGSDDIPIPAQEWRDRGGLVKVDIDPDDPSYIIITVIGMSFDGDIRAPYRVGVMSSSGGAYYSAMYVLGSGTMYDKRLLSVSTGAANTEVEVGVTIDNPFISTLAQAATALIKPAAKYSGIVYTLSGESVSVNRADAGNEFATSKISAFDSLFAGKKLSALDANTWGFDDFDAYFANLVLVQFSNQLFGNAGGARVLDRESYFRIDDATTTQQSVSWSASHDTILNDWDKVFSGKKLSAFDDAWIGHKLHDFDIKPIRSTAVPVDQLVPNPSVEVDATGWSIANTVATGLGFTSGKSPDFAGDGASSFRAHGFGNGTVGAGNNAFVDILQTVPLTGVYQGDRLYFEIWGMCLASGPGANLRNMSARIRWLNGGATLYDTSMGVAQAYEFGEKTFYLPNQPVPANATAVRVYLTLNFDWTSGPGANSDVKLYADAFTVKRIR